MSDARRSGSGGALSLRWIRSSMQIAASARLMWICDVAKLPESESELDWTFAKREANAWELALLRPNSRV